MTIIAPGSLWRFASICLLLMPIGLIAQVNVFTFHDANNNGVQDGNEELITGLVVSATDAGGNTFPLLDDGAGSFFLPEELVTSRLRIQVTGYNDKYQQGVAGPTSVFFLVNGESANVAVSTGPNQSPKDARVMIPCYEGGVIDGRKGPAFVSFPYEVDGIAKSKGGQAADPVKDAEIQEIGSTWGVAYQNTTERAFASTLLKRHVGLGPEGMGGVYMIDYGNDAAISNFNLQGIVPSEGPAIDLGDVLRDKAEGDITSGEPYALTTTNFASYDMDAFDKVGAVGFGDIDLEEDERTLWMVNLNQKSLVALDVSGENIVPGTQTVKHYPLFTMSGLPNLNYRYSMCINTGGNLNQTGSEPFTDPNRVAWDKNKYSSGGTSSYVASLRAENLMNKEEKTSDEPLYKTFRKGTFSYNIPVPTTEEYEVTLHFAEPNNYSEGDRLFDIMAEGEVKAGSFDIVKHAGGAKKATTMTFTVLPTDGMLDIEFVAKQGAKVTEALVAGIEVTGESIMESGVLRPWGLTFHEGFGYLGLVSDGSTSKSRSHLFGFVLRFDPDNMGGGFTEVLSFPLAYPRERASNAHLPNPQPDRAAEWQAWVSNWDDTYIELRDQLSQQQRLLVAYPQPLISDINFTDDGGMVIGLMDRWGHQMGHDNYPPVLESQTLISNYGAGDLLRSFDVGGQAVLESENFDPGTAFRKDDGPSFEGEFFFDDHFVASSAHHGEISTGGNGILPGSNQVVNTVFNPIATQGVQGFDYSGVYTQGIQVYNTSNGAKERAYLFVDQYIQGKANGLGDIEFAAELIGGEVGNYVWCDGNGNGIQDPQEFGIDGVMLTLHDKENSNAIVEMVTTANGGEFVFSNIMPNHEYMIRIDLTKLQSLGYTGEAPDPDQGGDDELDSDGDLTMFPGFSTYMFTSGPLGFNDHSVDFAFLGPDANDCTLYACIDAAAANCAVFDLADIENCVKVEPSHIVSLFADIDPVTGAPITPIVGTSISVCTGTDLVIWAMVSVQGDPNCYALAQVTLSPVDPQAAGSPAYQVTTCATVSVDLNQVLTDQGSSVSNPTFFRDIDKSDQIANPSAYTPASFPSTVYFMGSVGQCMIMGTIEILEGESASVDAGEDLFSCGYTCVDLTLIGSSFTPGNSGAVTAVWRDSTGNGTFTDGPDFADARLYCPDSADVESGHIKLYLEVLDDPCAQPQDSVTITFYTGVPTVLPGLISDLSCKDSFAIDPEKYDPFEGCRFVFNCQDTVVGEVIDYNLLLGDCQDTSDRGVALNFDGLDDWVSLDDLNFVDEGVASEYTVEMWIKPDAYTPGSYGAALFAEEQNLNDGVVLSLDATGYLATIHLGQSGALISSTFLAPLNVWTHVALVQDEDGTHIFANGEFIETLLDPAYPHVETDVPNASLGAFPFGAQRFFDGCMDEVRIWNYARTQEQISCNLSAGVGPSEGLVATYSFENGVPCMDNTGQDGAIDNSGNGSDGLLLNFALDGTQMCMSNYTDGNLSPVVKQIVRTSKVTYDKEDYFCMDTIGIRALNFDLFMCPPERDTLYCHTPYLKDEEGHPSPSETGAPTVGGVPLWPQPPALCDILVTYKDTEFESECPMLIKREWFVKNSCLGTFDSCAQWLMIMDTIGPTIIRYDTAAFYQPIPATSHECAGEVYVPKIMVEDTCSDVKQVKAMIHGYGTAVLEYNSETGYYESHKEFKIPVAEISNNGLSASAYVTYEVLDGCHNSTQVDSLPLIVVDNVRPVTICDKGLNVTVSDSIEWVHAESFDEGSSDNCGISMLLARRTDWATACGVDLCDNIDTLYETEHHDLIWHATLDDDKIHNPVEAHYARAVEWLCEDGSLCAYPVLSGWFYDLAKYATLECVEHPYEVDDAYFDELFSYFIGDQYATYANTVYSCLDLDLLVSADTLASNLSFDAGRYLFANNLLDVRKALFDLGAQIGGGWSDAVPFCCEDACQDVTVEVLAMDYWCNWSTCWTTVTVEDKSPPKIIHELADGSINCSTYKKYYAEDVNDALAGNFEGIQASLGTYDVVRHSYGDAPDRTSFPLYTYNCEFETNEYDSLVYDEHLGYQWVTYYQHESEYKLDSMVRFNGLIEDNCGLVMIEEKPWVNLDACGNGYIKRVFKFVGQCSTGPSGHVADTIKRTQTIWVTNDCEISRPMFDLPRDTVVNTCGIEYTPGGNVGGVLSPDNLGAAEYLFDNDCRLVGIAHSDKVFRIVGGDEGCYKIIRTWYLGDWCALGGEPIEEKWWTNPRYEGKYLRYRQKILVVDQTPPECIIDSIPAVITAAGCEYNFNTHVAVVDECGLLDYHWSVINTKTDEIVGSDNGELNTGKVDGFGVSVDALPAGSYKLKVIVTDGCQNESLCDVPFVIDANKKPTPVCITSLTVDLTPMDSDDDGVVDTAMAVIWANEFDASSQAACGSSDESLTFRIDNGEGEAALPDADATSITLGCADQGTKELRMYVIDQSGTWDYCTVLVLVQNNASACGSVATESGMLVGEVITEHGEEIEQVRVMVEGNSGVALWEAEDVSGQFAIDVTKGVEAYVRPQKNTDPLNGVATSDLILIQKDILGKAPLDSWYKEEAADANDDGKVSALDLVTLRKLILGMIDKLPESDSWRFYEKESNRSFYHIYEMLDEMRADFIGVKIGDVNGTTNPALRAGRSSEAFTMELPSNLKGNVLSFASSEDREISGLQFTVEFDPDRIEINGILETGKLNLSGEHVNISSQDKGWITISWNPEDGQNVRIEEGQELFALEVIGKENLDLSNSIAITSKVTQAEVYLSDGLESDVNLRFTTSEESAGFALYQNRPNPWKSTTIVGFTIPESSHTSLEVFDINGKMIRSFNADLAKGYNEWEIAVSDLPSSGVYYYKLRTEDQTAIKKMVLIQ